MTCGIYLLTHIESGRKYVGQSVDIEKRLLRHSHGCKNQRIGRAVLKYGWAAFSVQILEECDKDALNSCEVVHVLVHDCVSPRGFNLTYGGGQAIEFSAESRAKMSAKRKGVPRSAETVAKVAAANRGKKRSPEAVANIAAGATGKKQSPELIAKRMANAKGKIHSAETRAKISAAKLGVKLSAERCAAMSEYRKGRPRNPESVARMMATNAAKKLAAAGANQVSLFSL